jgi:sterol desaturase/sphingolipid hydroxylase (fatty acid hydroxylase superfamily)
MVPIETKIAVGATFAAFIGLELATGRFAFRAQTSRADVILDAASALIVPAIIIPAVIWLSWHLTALLAPASADQWADWPGWAMFAAFLVADDLSQYGWHRLSHTSWLYPLHRAHHSVRYLSVRVVYRNNLVYYAMMPGLWLSGALFYYGLGSIYALYGTMKMVVIIGAHASVPWDAPLRRWRVTRPLIWLLERVISTPSTHSAHHGLHAADGVTHYRGNYRNFLFLWDVLFGTAKITGRRPEAFGIEDLPPQPWFRELVWPWRRAPLDQPPA